MTKSRVAKAITGTPRVKVCSSKISFLNSPGTPTTNKILKTFEPNMLPRATSGFFCQAALAETRSSGREVPRATAAREITPGAIFKRLDSSITESIKYLAPSQSAQRF